MASFDFPPDLVAAQRAWFEADAARTSAAQTGTDEEFLAADRRLQEATTALQGNPWWATLDGGRYAARMALREAARS